MHQAANLVGSTANRREQGRAVLIAANPRAGAADSGSQVENLRAALHDLGLQAEILTDRNAAIEKAASLHRSGELRALVAAGGDGTAADLINSTEPGLPLALLPLGTENLLARSLAVPRAPVQVASVIADGAVLQLDAGRANGRLFTLMAGCGFDADVVGRLHSNRNGHITQLSYAKPIWDSVRNYRYPEFRVTYRLNSTQQETPMEHSVTARWAFASNLPRYAAGLSFSPAASATDGLLDLCLFQSGSFRSGMRFLAGVVTGRHSRMSDCVTAQATRVVIESDQTVSYQLDGDPGGILPLTIDVVPRRLTMIVPPAFAAKQQPCSNVQDALAQPNRTQTIDSFP